jgi:hypothetical protein
MNGVVGDRHLNGMTVPLRNGDTGRVREAIRATIEYTMVGEEGMSTLDIKPQGLLGAKTAIANSGCRGPEPMGIITWKHELLVVPFRGEWAA